MIFIIQNVTSEMRKEKSVAINFISVIEYENHCKYR